MRRTRSWSSCSTRSSVLMRREIVPKLFGGIPEGSLARLCQQMKSGQTGKTRNGGIDALGCDETLRSIEDIFHRPLSLGARLYALPYGSPESTERPCRQSR